MNPIDFIKRDPDSFDIFSYNLIASAVYNPGGFNPSGVTNVLNNTITKEDVLNLIEVQESVEGLNKFISIDFALDFKYFFNDNDSIVEPLITYFATGLLGDELYNVYANDYPIRGLRSLQHAFYRDFICNTELGFLQFTVEHYPNFLPAPGTVESSEMIVNIFANMGRWGPKFTEVNEALEYLRGKGYVITDPDHIPSAVESSISIKLKELYNLSTTVTPRQIVNMICGHSYNKKEKELLVLHANGLDINTQIPETEIVGHLRDEPDNWRQNHQTVNLVELCLLVYTPSNCIQMTKCIHTLKELGINHQNDPFTHQLLTRCIGMSKKVLAKHEKLRAAVFAFGNIQEDEEDYSDSDFEI